MEFITPDDGIFENLDLRPVLVPSLPAYYPEHPPAHTNIVSSGSDYLPIQLRGT